MKDLTPYELAERFGIHYIGDGSPEYGGLFYNTDDWTEYDYASAIRITDLDRGCGFNGAVMVEPITILRDEKKLREALKGCGFEDEETNIHVEIEALCMYGYYDPVDGFNEPTLEVLQLEEDESLTFDGWKAKRIKTDLLSYLSENHLESIQGSLVGDRD